MSQGFYRGLQAELHSAQPARRHHQRRHVDEGHPIDLRYDPGFHRPPAPRHPLSGAASVSDGTDPYGDLLSGAGSWRVEAFEDAEPEDDATVYGAGELDDEEPEDDGPSGSVSAAPSTSGGSAAAAFLQAASRSISFSDGDAPDVPIWGTGELEEAEQAQGPVSASLSDEDEAPVWGTGELADAEPESGQAPSGAAPAGSAPEAAAPAAPSQADSPDGSAAPATGGAADLAAATFSRIAAHTDDDETRAFANDLHAILGGRKDHPSTQAPGASGGDEDGAEPLPPYDSRPVSAGFSHADFDRWGETTRNLSTATSYDVGSFDLSQQFDAFDRELEAAERRRTGGGAMAVQASVRSPRDEYAEDMSDIVSGVHGATPTPATTPVAVAPAVSAPVAPAPAGPGGYDSPAPTPVAGAWTPAIPAARDPVAGGGFPATPSPAPSAAPTVPWPAAMSDDIPLDPGTGGMSIDERMLEMGDIILSTTPDLSSGVIRLGTGSPVSHSLIYIGGGQVVEAIGPGVVLRSLAEAVDHSNVAVAFRKPDLTPEQALIVRDFVGQQVGKPYNKVGIVRQAGYQLDRRVFCSGKSGDELERCLNWVGSINLGTSDNSSFFCSELVVAAFANAGAPLTTTPPNWSSPGDLAELRLSGRLSYVGHLKAPPLSR